MHRIISQIRKQVVLTRPALSLNFVAGENSERCGSNILPLVRFKKKLRLMLWPAVHVRVTSGLRIECGASGMQRAKVNCGTQQNRFVSEEKIVMINRS